MCQLTEYLLEDELYDMGLLIFVKAIDLTMTITCFDKRGFRF